MVHADPFVSLALCAKSTSRIKLGIAVTSPALRSAPAAAAALSSLNALAPGRVICGVGTGNTARRTLGLRPTKMVELESFTAVLQDLTAGCETDYREGTRTSGVRFLHVGGCVNTEDPVEFVVAAFGPKGAAVAGRLGTGIISFALHAPAAWSTLGQARRAAAQAAGNSEKTHSYLVSSLYLLADGEDRYGDAVKDAMGHIAVSALILAVEDSAFRAALPQEEAAAVDRLLHLRGTGNGRVRAAVALMLCSHGHGGPAPPSTLLDRQGRCSAADALARASAKAAAGCCAPFAVHLHVFSRAGPSRDRRAAGTGGKRTAYRGRHGPAGAEIVAAVGVVLSCPYEAPVLA
ncbi:LLM class flavin-dependent oxidoreductase [Streptomyces sp. NA04227]|uniref:LLM class flavin-dependent oxidoreductase n=1 Tax=Streptomyces sp. NA04227 TaxID=2742136 RepID=UPI00159133CD|nr:LLM class flavin-dependent oxidoreductase [Streptomyces sp. NA04227]QKW04998.1 LLM class flavin-dependent oxidoreductase [Streptomyces sp. NA04227]